MQQSSGSDFQCTIPPQIPPPDNETSEGSLNEFGELNPILPCSTYPPFYSKLLTTPRTSYYDTRIELAELGSPAAEGDSWTSLFGASSKLLVVFVFVLLFKALKPQETTPMFFLGGIYA